LRLVKVVRTFTMLRELAFMVYSLGGAMRGILWASVLLFFLLTFCSIVAVHALHPLAQEAAATGVYEGCSRCPRAFRTVMDSNLTFMQTVVASDSWGRVSIPIMEMFPWTTVFFCFMLVSITLGVMNLILACIVDEAMESREADKAYQFDLKRKVFDEACKHLMDLWRSLDNGGDGLMSHEEMQKCFNDNAAFAAACRSLDVKREDFNVLFEMMDRDKSGRIDYEEFVMCLYQIEHQSSKTMLTFTNHEIRQLRKEFHEEMHLLHRSLLNQDKDSAAPLERTGCMHWESQTKSCSGAGSSSDDTGIFHPHSVSNELHISVSSMKQLLSKLEEHFSCLLQELVQEESGWPGCATAHCARNPDDLVDDPVAKEGIASENWNCPQTGSSKATSRSRESYQGQIDGQSTLGCTNAPDILSHASLRIENT